MVGLVFLSCAAAALAQAPARAAATVSSRVVVSGEEAETGSTTQVTPGGTASWLATYQNTTGAAVDVQIDQELTGAQTYEDGSLHVPDGWQVSASVDGAEFEARDPVPGDRFIRAGSTVPGEGLGKTEAIPRPLMYYVPPSNTAGDGFAPILHGRRVFNVFHHQKPGAGGLINCVEKATGLRCPGYPVAPSSQVGPAGTGPADIGSVAEPQVYVDATGRYGQRGAMYFAAQRSGDIGVACFNLDTARNCGYTELGDLAMAPVAGAPQRWDGVEEVDGRLYGMGADGRMYCYDLEGAGPCPGQPFATSMVPYRPDPSKVSGLLSYHAAVDGRVYTAVNYFGQSLGSLGARLHCFDPATNAECSDFAGPRTVPGTPVTVTGPLQFTSGNVSSVFEWRSPAGSLRGICAGGLQTSGAMITGCFSPTGTLLSGPASPPGLFTGVPAYYTPKRPALVGTRMYIPVLAVSTASARTGLGICYDWAAEAQCAGFGSPQSWDGVINGDTRDYGYTADGSCMWGLGDKGILWTFDAETGLDPCKTVTSRIDIRPSSEFYCDGDAGHAKAWKSVDVSNVVLSDFESLLVTVKDAGGAPIPGFTDRDLVSEGTTSIDLSTIPIAAQEKLTVTAIANAHNSLSWDRGEPRLTVTFDGDPMQICLRAAVAEECSAGTVTDHAVATTTATGADPETVESEKALQVFKPADCGVDVAVQKQKDDDAPATARPGEEVLYNIDVSANTPMGATGIALEDPIPEHTLFVRASHSGAATGGKVVWPVFDLEGGQTLRLEVVLRIGDDAPDRFVVRNVATASDDGSQGPDAAPDNNSDDDDTDVESDATDPDPDPDPDPGDGGGDDDSGSGGGDDDGGGGGGGGGTYQSSLPFAGGDISVLVQAALVSLVLGATMLRAPGHAAAAAGRRRPRPGPPEPPFPTGAAPPRPSRPGSYEPRYRRPY